MQTRSMTRKGITRAASLDAHPVPPKQALAAPRPSTPPALQVVSSETARIEHADENTAIGVYEVARGDSTGQQQLSASQSQDQQTRAQHQLLSIVQAQAYANAVTQRNTEERIQQAFEVTEARLHQTAEALVRSHAHDQAQETRRDLGLAIQKALVDAHTQAHAQAMASAQDHLNQFTAEIRKQIQAQLASAVDEVSTRGVAYIQSQTEDRLAQLPHDVQAEIARSIERGLLSVKQEAGGGHFTSEASVARLQRKLDQVEEDLPKQLAASEKRSHDGALSSASAQAERIIAVAEHRLVGLIDDRFSKLESHADDTVRAAVLRAETHCNVLEQRVGEGVKRAVDEFHTTRALRTETYVDRVLEIKLEAKIQAALTSKIEHYVEEAYESKWKPLMSHQATAAVPALVDRLVATKVQDVLDNYLALKVEERVQAVVGEVVPNIINRQLATSLEPHIQAVMKTVVKEMIDQHYAVSLRPRVEAIAVDSAVHTVNKKYDDDIRPRVEKLIDASAAKNDVQFEKLKATIKTGQANHASTTTAPPLGVQWPSPPTMQWASPPFVWPSPQISPQTMHWPSPMVVLTQSARQEDASSAETERQINEALALAYPTKTTKSVNPTKSASPPTTLIIPSTPATSSRHMSEQGEDLISSSSKGFVNPRAILAARTRGSVGDKMIAMANFSDLEPPKLLSSLRPAEIQRFVKAYSAYETMGGRELWTSFCSPALLAYLRTIECEEGSSDDDILVYLNSKLTKANSDVNLIEKKFGQVKIDPEASNSVQKVESILIGVEMVLFEMGLKDSANELGVAVPLETQMKIVMEKLPLTLRTLVEKRLKYAPTMKTKRQFAALLFDEAKYYTWQ